RWGPLAKFLCPIGCVLIGVKVYPSQVLNQMRLLVRGTWDDKNKKRKALNYVTNLVSTSKKQNRTFTVTDTLSILSKLCSYQISNIGPCPNCPADTVPDMDFRTSRVRQKSPGQRPCTTLPIRYPPDASESKTSTKSDHEPTKVCLWEGFLNGVNNYHFDNQWKFKKPKFAEHNRANIEEDVRSLFCINICETLSNLMGPDYEYTRRNTKTPGIPDFNCHQITITKTGKSFTLIFPIEVKRRHILGPISDDNNNKEIDDCNDNGENRELMLSELYYQDQYVKDAIKQIYSYMAHAYLILLAKDSYYSPNPLTQM
ncbi:12960_t:CDS:2, partial [Funneliformis geosporum]